MECKAWLTDMGHQGLQPFLTAALLPRLLKREEPITCSSALPPGRIEAEANISPLVSVGNSVMLLRKASDTEGQQGRGSPSHGLAVGW